jgi:protein involved in polysaccharide export with SLBB domain
VWQPGDYELCDNTNTLSELIQRAEGLKGNEFATRGQITRRKKDFTYEVIAFDVRNVVAGSSDFDLQPDDEVYIPTIFDLREEYFLIVKGEVNRPDTIQFAENMTVEDAIMMCGGIRESASAEKIEVARRIQYQSAYTSRTAEIFTFNISKDLQISAEASEFNLKPFDEIRVRSSPGYKIQESAFIEGEVLYDGEYVLESNEERISDLVNAAGGFTPAAYVKGASLKRKFTTEEKLKMESILSVAKSMGEKDTVEVNRLLIQDYYSVGIDLESALSKPGGAKDVILISGDMLYIPKYKGVVKVSGAVMHPNAVIFQEGRGLRNYLSNGGGYQSGARKKPYVVYMNGNVSSTKSFLGIKNYPKVEPGAEIIVPMKVVKTNSRTPEIMAIATTSVSLASVFAMLMSFLK